MSKILIIEDDPTIRESLSSALTHHEFTVFTAPNSETGLPLLKQKKPDLIILDVMLPGLDGFETCKRIRSANDPTPIILLTAKNQESDKLLGFELGADDYVPKPFSARELIARVKAVLKRAAPRAKTPDSLSIGPAAINFTNYTITKNGTELPLSPKEHAILLLLSQNPDTVLSRSDIIDRVWGDDYFPSPKTIDNFIVKLRGKIEDDPKNPKHLLTIHGAGYKFKT